MQLEEYQLARQREDLREIVTAIMTVDTINHVPPAERGIVRITGQLTQDPEQAYAAIAPRFEALGYTPLFQESNNPDNVNVMAMPALETQRESRLWLALLMFALTVASTIFVGGGTLQGFDWVAGLSFSASLMSILLAHELGHYLTARRLGVATSYPFFIPMPITLIGTMGAFISMKEPPPDRRALLAIAIAGPVAGLVVAIPVLFLGLTLSEVKTFEAFEQEIATAAAAQGITDTEDIAFLMEGNSLVYYAAKLLVFGQSLPSATEDVDIHPVALAGWVGLLITGLNLMPAGQLDGGHLFYAWAGRRYARYVTLAVAGALALLGILWVGWFLWAGIIFFLGQYRAPLRNELVPLDNRERAMAIGGIILFVLVFTPIPITIQTLGG